MTNNKQSDRDEAKLRYALRSELRRATPASAPAQGDLQRTVNAALRRTLGQRPTDAKSFREALSRSFEADEGEAEGDSTSGTPPREAIAGLTIAQSSLYAFATIVRDNALPRLDRLYPLLPDADPQIVQARTRLARKYILKLVSEMGKESGPITRKVNELFEVLLGSDMQVADVKLADHAQQTLHEYVGMQLYLVQPSQQGDVPPENIMGRLYADLFGTAKHRADINTTEEFQDRADFELVSKLLILLRVAWHWYLKDKDKDLSEALFLLRRALRAIADAIANVEYEMDSAGLDDEARQLTHLNKDPKEITVAEWLEWLRDFATDTAVDALDEGGRRGIFALRGEMEQLYNLTDSWTKNPPLDDLDVKQAVEELKSYLQEAKSYISPK